MPPTMPHLGSVSSSIEIATRAGEFLMLARHIAGRPRGPSADAEAAERRLSPRVVAILKQSVEAGGLDSPTWAGAIPDYRNISDAFVESLRTASVFDRLLADGMRRAPMRTRTIVCTVGVSGAGVAERMVKPISSLSLDVASLAERKSMAMVAASAELFKLSKPSAVSLFNTELKNGVAATTDALFLSELAAGVTPTASAGDTVDAVLADLAALLASVNTSPTSRVYFVIDPANAKKLVTKTNGNGAAFPNFGLNGGTLVPGVMGLVSDQLPSGVVLLIVSDGLVGDNDIVTLRSSSHADIQMSTTPDSPPSATTVWMNLWQQGNMALLAERYFAFTVARDNSVAALSGVSY